MSRSPSPHYDRECLYAPLRRADEVPTHTKTEELAELHDSTFWRGCQGESCKQGRAACTDRCEADTAPSMWRIVLAYLMGKDPF